MKKIGFLINSFGGGGAEKTVSNLIEEYSKNENLEVHLILIHNEDLEYRIAKNVIIHRVDVNCLNARFYLKMPAVSRGILKILDQYEIEHVVSLLFKANICHILTKVFGNKRKIIISERSHTEYSVKSYFVRRLIGFFYNRSDKIIVISNGIKSTLTSIFSVKNNKIVVIPNPIKPVSIEKKEIIKSDSINFLSVGRLTPVKNHKLMIKAFKYCVLSNDKVRLDILGDGPLLGELKELTCSLGIQDNVIFHGFVKNTDFYYRKSDVFVLTSLYEGFGNVVTEAMSYGLPVVCTDCPSGPSEITDYGKFGILVPNDSIEELKRALFRMMEQAQLRASYSLKSFQRAEYYELDNISKRYINEMINE